MSERHLNPGSGRWGQLFVTVTLEDKGDGKRRLSIVGVEGPKSNGDAAGSCGQCIDALDRLTVLNAGWTPELVAGLREVWERWHLNDMRPGCEHQRAIDTRRKVEVVTYGLTTEAYQARLQVLARAAECALARVPFEPTDRARALAELSDWYKPRFSPPDADSPLSGCYEVKKRELKAVGWVKPDEHPDGLLGFPCPACGYKYGTAWLYEPIPEDVLAFLQSLPEASNRMPAAWRS